jgi:hypothetical protein
VSSLASSLAAEVRRRREGLLQVALAMLAALVYFGVRNLTVGEHGEAYANADRIQRLGRSLHIAWEQSLQEPIAEHLALVTIFNWIYIWGHWPVIITAALLLYRYRRDRFRLLRNAMFISGAIGFFFFGFFPVAPPRLADPGVIDFVTLHSHAYRGLQPPGLTNQYAAFPSLHFGWNVLVGIAVWGATTNRFLRTLAVAGPTAMGVAVVVTGNHYVIDAVAGLALALFAWLVARRLPH